jgi:hypothetical protein
MGFHRHALWWEKKKKSKREGDEGKLSKRKDAWRLLESSADASQLLHE